MFYTIERVYGLIHGFRNIQCTVRLRLLPLCENGRTLRTGQLCLARDQHKASSEPLTKLQVPSDFAPVPKHPEEMLVLIMVLYMARLTLQNKDQLFFSLAIPKLPTYTIQ